MKKRILAVVFLLFICLSYKGQTDSVYYGNTRNDSNYKAKKKPDRDWLKNVTYGGNLQLYFGPNFSYANLSPAIGYNITENFNAGAGFIYSYSSVLYRGYGRFSQTAYGPYCYARYYFLESFFAQGEFDMLRQSNIFNISDPNTKVWVNYAWIGGGYRQSMGKNAALIASLMLNVTPNRLSIYPNPIIQFGFVSGF